MNTKAATFFKKAEQYRTAILIGIFFLYTVFMQAAPSLAALSHEYKTGMFVVILLLYLAGCFFMTKKKHLTTDDKVFLLNYRGRNFAKLLCNLHRRGRPPA